MDFNAAYRLCQFTPDGKEFILADKDGLHVWDLEQGKEKHSTAVKSVSILSPDAATYLTAKIHLDANDEAKTDKKTDANLNLSDIILGNARTGAQTVKLPNSFSFHGSVGDSIAFAPDSRSIAVVNTAKREIQILELSKLALQRSFSLPLSASFHLGKEEHFDYHIAFSADGKVLFLGTVGGVIHRWDLNTNKELPPLEKHAVWLFSTVSGVHQTPDGKTVISVGVDGVIRCWEATTGKEQTDRKSYAGKVCAALSPDGRLTVVGDSGGRVDLWDVRSGKLVRNIVSEGPLVNKVAFAPDSKSLAVGCRSGDVMLYDALTGSIIKTLPQKTVMPTAEPGQYLSTLLYSPNGQFLYVHDFLHAGRLWNTASGEVAWTTEAEDATAWTSDGKKLLVNWGGLELAWLDAVTGKVLSKAPILLNRFQNFGGVACSLALSPDGRHVAMGLLDGTLSILDGRTMTERKRIKTVVPPKHPNDPLEKMINDRKSGPHCLAFSPDGKWIICHDSSGALLLLDAVTGAEILRLEGHDGSVYGSATALAFSPSGRTVLSSGLDGQVYLWDLRPKPEGKPLRPLEALWNDLRGEDSGTAYKAVWALSDSKDVADFLASKIASVQPPDEKAVTKHLDALSSDNFKERQAATKALADLGDRAAGALADAIKIAPSLEAERRIRQLLEALQGEPSPAELQQLRAIQALELASTPPARRLLQRWSEGSRGARLTEGARAAVERLANRRQ